MITLDPDGSPAEPGDAWARTVRHALLNHYDRFARRLPWRGETDPYRIWVSEVMLQQTRVETVVPYYRAWLERFPDLGSLADADMDDVLVRWEGLGYYRRAKNLHAGAIIVRERHAGQLPRTVTELRRIPGVGEYTAGAVASIAFAQAVPAIDGNVRRVLARLFDEPEPTAAWLRERATWLMDTGRPGDWNQALMDLGATLCTPRSPACGGCPLASACAARQAGTQGDRPSRRSKPPVPVRTFAVAVAVDHEGKALVLRRPPEGLLGGLWCFPDAEISASDGTGSILGHARQAAERAGARTDERASLMLEVVRHRFTHLAATYVPVLLRVDRAGGRRGRWVSLEEPKGVALPRAQRRIAAAAWLALTKRETVSDANP
jgi:A/G-specific adenine glycosylase